MKKFHRCGNPQTPCDLSKTREVVTKEEWEEHCIASPNCAIYGEEVSLLAAMSPKVKAGIAAGIGLLVIIFLALAFRTDPLAKELRALSSEVRQLESKLNTLEAMPRGEDATAEGSAEALRKMPGLLAASKSRLESIIGSRDASGFESERRAILDLKKQRQELGRNAMPQTERSDTLQAEAGQLVASYQDTEDRLAPLSERIAAGGDNKLIPECETLRNQIDDGMMRTANLLKVPASGPGDVSTLTGPIDTELAELEKMMGAFAAVLPPPFSAAEATLRINASSTLVESLIVPLLNGRSQGSTIEAGGAVYFSGGAGGRKHRVIVQRTEASPLAGLAAKKCDLVISDLEPTENERTQFAAAFPGAAMDSHANAQVIALDALTFSVHPENPLEVLTPSQLSGGGRLIGSSPGSAGNQTAARLGVRLTDSTGRRPADAVLSDKNAIGVGLFHEEGSNIRAKRLAYKASPSAAALKPSPFTIATEDYKYAFRIVAWNSPASSPEAVEFVKFITSQEGQKIVSDQGYVDLRLKLIPGEVDPTVLAALAQATGLKKISGARRLSTNFRFATGEDTFDLKAQGDLERVPLQIAQNHSSDRTVILGFTDNSGGPNINVPLSQRRAEAVAVILRKSGIEVKTAGLGDSFPVDSNESVDGKARNRRSEVWLVTP